MTAVPEPSASKPVSTGDIIARPASYYRNTRYLMTIMFIAMGAWFGYDGFVRYPAENARIEQLERIMDTADKKSPEYDRATTERQKLKLHTDTDLLLQRALAFLLPPAGLAILFWAHYNSRGVLRLSGQTLHVPGHPPVPFSTIRSVDKGLWDRKGIAYVEYLLPNSVEKKTVKLDDFIYDRSPTDAIYKAIEEYLKNPE
jgi:hypothetical protein